MYVVYKMSVIRAREANMITEIVGTAKTEDSWKAAYRMRIADPTTAFGTPETLFDAISEGVPGAFSFERKYYEAPAQRQAILGRYEQNDHG